MYRTISLSEANRRFPEFLREVSEGESFTVVSHGRAIARILPVAKVQERFAVERLLNFLESCPIRQSGDWTRTDLYH
jgi:prevent-host-death family protein